MTENNYRVITIGFRRDFHYDPTSTVSNMHMSALLNRITEFIDLNEFRLFLGEMPGITAVTEWADYENSVRAYDSMVHVDFASTDSNGVTVFKICALESRESNTIRTQLQDISSAEIDGVRFVCEDEPFRPAAPVWKAAK